jgi:HSP20 family protein
MFSLMSRPSAAALSPARDVFREPLGLVDSLFSDILNFRPSSNLIARARLDVAERDTSYEVRAELPGVNKDDISVDIDGAWVSISAKRQSQDERKEGERLLYSERSQESYGRSFELPQTVDAAEATARFENGVLNLTLPKKGGSKTTRINIR